MSETRTTFGVVTAVTPSPETKYLIELSEAEASGLRNLLGALTLRQSERLFGGDTVGLYLNLQEALGEHFAWLDLAEVLEIGGWQIHVTTEYQATPRPLRADAEPETDSVYTHPSGEVLEFPTPVAAERFLEDFVERLGTPDLYYFEIVRA